MANIRHLAIKSKLKDLDHLSKLALISSNRLLMAFYLLILKKNTWDEGDNSKYVRAELHKPRSPERRMYRQFH